MLLVDVSMVFHRCFHAMDDLQTTTGIPTGMEYGTFRILEMLTKNYEGHRLILCYDSKGSWRRKKDERYKANRKHKPKEGDTLSDFLKRANALKPILNQLYHHAEQNGEEADDLMFRLARSQLHGAEPHGIYIYTNDNDLLQAVCDEKESDITIIQLKSRRSNIWEWDVAKVLEKFGVLPFQLPIYRAMIGDKSDNLEGVGRVDKDLIRECVRAAFRDYSGMKPIEAFVIQLHKYREIDRWTNAEWEKIVDFMEKNLLHRNYELMVLKMGPVIVENPSRDLDLVKDFLISKEIRSLRICREIMKDEIVNEEF